MSTRTWIGYEPDHTIYPDCCDEPAESHPAGLPSDYRTLQEAKDAYPRERIASDGYTTCLWHRQHDHYMNHIVPLLPRCPICGGIGDERRPEHELCRVRRAKGLPIQQLDTITKCSCSNCRKS